MSPLYAKRKSRAAGRTARDSVSRAAVRRLVSDPDLGNERCGLGSDYVSHLECEDDCDGSEGSTSRHQLIARWLPPGLSEGCYHLLLKLVGFHQGFQRVRGVGVLLGTLLHARHCGDVVRD